MGLSIRAAGGFSPQGAMSRSTGVYLGDKGITGRAIVIVGRNGKVAWVKNYDIPVVPDVKEVAAALGQVKAATA
jgi:alkyl hydroperoxide reductase subunit AhpC